MKLFQKLDKCYKISILTLLITIIAFLGTVYFFTINRNDIPLGILLGGILMSLIYFLQGLGEKKDSEKGTPYWTISFITIKLTVLVAVSLIIGFMYYRWNMKYFNIFSFVGMYTVATINMVVIYIVDKK